MSQKFMQKEFENLRFLHSVNNNNTVVVVTDDDRVLSQNCVADEARNNGFGKSVRFKRSFVLVSCRGSDTHSNPSPCDE